jgi:type I restriction enzyme S subunit
MKRFEVFPGDILMSCSGTIGKTAIVPVGAPAGIINQALLKLSCSEKLNNQYLCVWMRSLYFQEAVFASVVGVALQNVASVAILKNIPISLPPLEQQKQIVERLDSMRAKTSEMAAAYDAKLTAATNLRQSILEAAFAGEL